MVTSSHDRRLEDLSVFTHTAPNGEVQLILDLSDVALFAFGGQRREGSVEWQVGQESTRSVDGSRFGERRRTGFRVVVVGRCWIVAAVLIHRGRAFVVDRVRPVIGRGWRGRGRRLGVDVLLVGMDHSAVDGAAGIQVVAAADESRVVGRREMIGGLVLSAGAVTTLVLLQELGSAPVDRNGTSVVDGHGPRLVLAENLLVLVDGSQVDGRDALVLRRRIQRAADRRGDVGEFGRPGFAVLLLVLAPLGRNDKVNGQDEYEQSHADTGDNGRPVHSAETAAGEPLRRNVVDRQGSGRPDGRWRRCGGRRAGHPQLNQIGDSASIATSVNRPDGGVEPAIVAVEIHQSQIHWVATETRSRGGQSFGLLERRRHFEPSFV